MRRTSAFGLVLFVCLLVPCGPAGAQTSDDLFNPDTLGRIDLLVNSRDWETLKTNFRTNDYYPADLRWNGMTLRSVGIRSRGFSSRSGTKPALRVDFNRYVGNQTFLGVGSIVLDNLTPDPTGLRERVAMTFYSRMGLVGPREAHVRLYVNNEYAGLYAVIESIDKSFLRRVFGLNATGTENDGYLFNYQWSSIWYFTYPGPDLDAYAKLFDPITHERASVSELYTPIEEMFRAINQSSDADFESAVGQYLDLPLFMKHVALQTFLAEADGIIGYSGVANFYLYRFEHSSRSQFILWDEDQAFRAVDFSIFQGHAENVLVRRAMAVPALRAIYFQTLLAAVTLAETPVQTGGRGWLEVEITRERDLIDSPMHEDSVKPYTNDEFETSIRDLIDFARLRPGFVRCAVAKITTPSTLPEGCR
jgi:spore coat protein CotH